MRQLLQSGSLRPPTVEGLFGETLTLRDRGNLLKHRQKLIQKHLQTLAHRKVAETLHDGDAGMPMLESDHKENHGLPVSVRFRSSQNEAAGNDANFGLGTLGLIAIDPRHQRFDDRLPSLLPIRRSRQSGLAIAALRCLGRKIGKVDRRLCRDMQFHRQALGQTWLIEPFAVGAGLADSERTTARRRPRPDWRHRPLTAQPTASHARARKRFAGSFPWRVKHRAILGGESRRIFFTRFKGSFTTQGERSRPSRPAPGDGWVRPSHCNRAGAIALGFVCGAQSCLTHFSAMTRS